MSDVSWTQLRIDDVRPLNATARNIKCELSLIDTGGEIVRLASGRRRSLRRPQFDLYKVRISGDAVRKPAIDHLRKGSVVVLDVPAHIELPGYVPIGQLPRPAVFGSIMYVGEQDGRPVMLEPGDPDVLFTAFRPKLTVMLDEIEFTEDEGAASVSWSISGEEQGA